MALIRGNTVEAVVNGIKMHYLDVGNPDALPIVLLHGMTLDHRMWNPQIEVLKENYRVITYDIRGHGKTEVLDGQYTYQMFVEDLIALLDHLQIDKAVLCGLSMGGAIAMRTFELNSERIHALILCDTRSEADSNETKHWRENSIKSIKQGGLEQFTTEFMEALFPAETMKDQPETTEFIRNTILSSSPLGICGVLLAQAARTDMIQSIQEINVPTLIIIGEKDNFTPISSSETMNERISDSELVIISGAGHLSNLENREEFNKHLLEFLEKLDNWYDS